MARNPYAHSPYWYAKKNGWTYSEKRSYTAQYLDLHGPGGVDRAAAGLACDAPARPYEGNQFAGGNPLLLGACIMMDIAVALRDGVARLADPAERDRIGREFARDLRRLRRPFYYARETARRRELALERRMVRPRRTTAPEPTPGTLLAAWGARKDSREAMLRLGGLLHDLECHVDNRLRFDEDGAVVGRNGGIRGWLRENLPELSPKYKTLMRYKALAVRVRQATGTEDPTPTSALLDGGRGEIVEGLLAEGGAKPAFSRLFAEADALVAPETVFLDPPGAGAARGRRRKAEEARTREKRKRRRGKAWGAG